MSIHWLLEARPLGSEIAFPRYNGNKNTHKLGIWLIIIPIMGKTIPALLPRAARLLAGFGENLKLARLRRKFSAESVAQRAGITRRTLSKVEQGDPGVALGIYARVMQVLRLENDLAHLAVDDVLGRKLQDAGITPKRRAPKKESQLPFDEKPEGNEPRDT
jgi:transcriptional regulator with XRE-family HTH domain